MPLPVGVDPRKGDSETSAEDEAVEKRWRAVVAEGVVALAKSSVL